MNEHRIRNLTRTSRRKFLATVATASLAAPFVLRQARAASKELVFVTWGGTYRAALEEGIIKPFTAETGINVKIIDTPDLAKIKAQVQTGNVQWDVFDAINWQAFFGSNHGLWEQLDPALFDAADLTIPVRPDAVPLYNAMGVVAWDSKRAPDGKHPKNFTEYFEIAKFPGRRTLRNRASETLEMALLADGVPPAKLYPLDIDRAFKKLETIRPSVVKWVTATPETISLVQTGEADFTYSYPSRVKAAGDPMACSFDQTLSQEEYLTVLKGAPNKENAFKFLSWAVRPEIQAATMEKLVLAPVSKKGFDMLSPEARKWIHPVDSPSNTPINGAWWGENLEAIDRRFKEWVML
ncbi:ABC transporter substrate-binding protein [Bradyrhizobium sp. U531]|uniref:ABC transporter substrate-binding protein n=1 Tax=Bradyrhizobium sp. U531 TaxID=3053458 RepID=UPI003F4296FA